MGLMDRGIGETVEGIGEAAEGLSEVFVPNATRAMELAAEIHQATLSTAAAEFEHAGTGWFDRMINGINRLPRPALALGTLGLFVFAMKDPDGFAERMIGLNEVPEPLWWLLGAIVSFYFGARELHYARDCDAAGSEARSRTGRPRRRLGDRLRGMLRRRRPERPAAEPDNPALSDWRDR